METTPHWWSGRLLELTEPECWELLEASEVGRIAWSDRDGPVVLPVNYAVRDRVLYLRTKPHSAMAAHLNDETVSLQIDSIEPFTRSGWSVLVRARAELVEYDLRPAGWAEPTPWPEGPRPLMARLTPMAVTGRRLLGA